MQALRTAQYGFGRYFTFDDLYPRRNGKN